MADLTKHSAGVEPEATKSLPYSSNKRAEDVVGKREIAPNTIILDFPCELGYHCPVCKYRLLYKGEYDERLDWSEYEGFLWCRVCNKDYPSALCMPDIDRAIEIYLDSVERALRLSQRLAEAEATTGVQKNATREEWQNHGE